MSKKKKFRGFENKMSVRHRKYKPAAWRFLMYYHSSGTKTEAATAKKQNEDIEEPLQIKKMKPF